MSTLQQRFAKLAADRPDISQADLARATGAKPPSVNAWFSGETKTMKAVTAAKAAQLYGCNTLWLSDGQGPMWPPSRVVPHEGAGREANEPPDAPTPSASAPHAEDGEIIIFQYDVIGGMDTRGKLLLEAEPPGIIKSWRVDREWLQLNVRSYTSLANLCIVTGFGPSMKGMFNPGDPLLMDVGVNRVDHEGVYFFRVGDEGYIKILQRVPEFDGPGFRLRVISKNEDFPPYDLSPRNPHLRIIGKILTVWKSEQY